MRVYRESLDGEIYNVVEWQTAGREWRVKFCDWAADVLLATLRKHRKQIKPLKKGKKEPCFTTTSLCSTTFIQIGEDNGIFAYEIKKP